MWGTITLAFLALLIEAIVGYPDRLVRTIGHPVMWMGQLISLLDRTLNHESMPIARRRAAGVLAVLILSGKKARLVWALTSLFMFMLAFGQTLLMKPDVIANWQYLVLALVCAALSEPDSMNKVR